jgi:hypothetical protein
MLNILKKLKKLKQTFRELARTKGQLEEMNQAIGRIEIRQLEGIDSNDILANEFKVFSQNGEDGIIQFLLRKLVIKEKVFIEFGVENYLESNTRFLLKNNNWSGLVLDGSKDDINYIKNDPIYWKHNLTAVQAFITKDNINELITKSGIIGEIGLLSIDIDGNDYWIWEAIDVINPAIVIIEYNFRFGKDKAVTIPYDENFVRSKAHYSTIYYGASLKALVQLGKKKGYTFVGCNSTGCNAFFVRTDLKPSEIKELTVEDGYVAGKFRESRNKSGKLIYLSHQEELQILSSLPLVDMQ